MLTTLTQIHKLQERYPFDEEELEILVRCHDEIESNKDNEENFLLRLALASPYSYYFLPGDELHDRVTWVEDYVLPMGFSSQLRAAVSADPFVAYANEGEEKSLERFLEGIADTGRRGPKEALRILYQIAPDGPSAEELLDLCFRLVIACDALINSNLDKKVCLKMTEDIETNIKPFVRSLASACNNEQIITWSYFIQWAETSLPLLSSPLSTFVHHLIFHRMPFPCARLPYARPKLENVSDIFTGAESPLLISLSLTSPHFSGKMRRLYSSETDGRSFNRLEWAVLGYDGPTLLTVKTASGDIIGAFTQKPWKDALNYYGSGDSFLFQLSPELKILWSTGPQNHFMFMHSGKFTSPVKPSVDGLPHGIGFGGGLSSKPRFFIPESFENCSAQFLDKTFETGDILPESALERFEINVMEIWGVGSDETIEHSIERRKEHRIHTEEAIHRARSVNDKTQFVKDLKSGFTPSKLYEHLDVARGRHEFRVDDKHGGYKVDHV